MFKWYAILLKLDTYQASFKRAWREVWPFALGMVGIGLAMSTYHLGSRLRLG